ncbi:hypothetical protein JW868_01190 [Candidatus Woesearchaeota archaeon]|nr:hypothetical protein [Candidatus Woesearchaeota archaeon]
MRPTNAENSSSSGDYAKGNELAIVSTLYYLLAVVVLSAITNSSIVLVFIGTLPLLIYLFFLYLFFNEWDLDSGLLWLAPFILPILFFLLWQSGSVGIMNSMNGPALTMLNILAAMIANIFSLLIQGVNLKRVKKQKVNRKIREHIVKLHAHYKQALAEKDAEKKKLELVMQDNVSQKQDIRQYEQRIENLKETVVHYHNQLQITKQNFNVTLRSIEDKCKSINFVIGRVYSNKHGGDRDLRGMLRIPKELYNLFSDLTRTFTDRDKPRLTNILKQILQKLDNMEIPEKDVIPVILYQKLTIKRDSSGNDRILSILERNDKDPIGDYHREAKEICSKMIDFLNK